LGDVIQRVIGRHEFDGRADVFGVEVNRMSQQIAVLFARRKLLAEFRAGFGAHAEGGARLEGDDAIAGGVAEERGIEFILRRVLAAEGGDRFNRFAVGFADADGGGVEQKGDVRFIGNFLKKHGVEN